MKPINYLFSVKNIRIISLIMFSLLATMAMGQSPEAINYQAALRNASGDISANKSVDFRFGIYSGAGAATLMYEETHSTSTDDHGLVNLRIGRGTATNGKFSDVNWGSDLHHLKVEVDTGSGYVDMGTMELVSVPYALSAKKVSDMKFSDISDLPGGNPAAGQVLRFDGAQWVFDSIPTVNAYKNGVGLILANDTFHADTSAAIWNAALLQGRAISSSTPADSSLLRWNAALNQWEFVNMEEGRWMENSLGNIYHNHGRVGVGTNAPSHQFHVAGSNDAVRIEGNSGLYNHGGKLNFGDGQFVFLEEYENNKIRLKADATKVESDSLNLVSLNGDKRFSVNTNLAGATTLNTFGSNQNLNVALTSSLGNNGAVVVYDSTGFYKSYSTVLSSGAGYFEIYGPNGNSNLRLTSLAANSDYGYVAVNNDDGNSRSAVLILPSGEGYISTRGDNGNRNAAFTTLINHPNNGFIAVDDSLGTTQAGIYVDAVGDGIVFGDQKNFRMPHPTKGGKEIWYGSLEGPELAAYMRGTATLKNGEVKITFPEHYQIVANTSTMTVVLTPLDAASKGLAVTEKSGDGFTVSELSNGNGNYSFDWEVKCVRKGYEEYRVVRDASESATSRDPENGMSELSVEPTQQ